MRDTRLLPTSLQSAIICCLSMEGISLGPSSTEDAATRSSLRALGFAGGVVGICGGTARLQWTGAEGASTGHHGHQ